ALGGSYARLRTDSRLVGKGASSQLLAVYFGEGEQMHDFRTMQDHAAPNTTSDLLFKGAVQDHARSVYSGLIRVRKEAMGTNAFQTNRNLVLSEGAHADSVPNLEIEANGVRCSHADYSLSEGEIYADEREIECWKHGSTFSLETGQPQSLPATQPVPTYRVRIEDGNVVVGL